MAFLPLRNVTEDYQVIIRDAAAVELQTTLPPGAHDTVLHGQKAQQDILLRHFALTNTSTVESVADSAEYANMIHLKPLSRGSILIASADAYQDPLIDFGTFKHPGDLQVMLAAYQKLEELIASPPFLEIGVSGMPSLHTKDAIVNELRNGTLSSWQHPVGTLAMMPRALGGVVDPRLCVWGVSGLRVVDASMMPIIPASHTSSTVYAVAEKVSCSISFALWLLLTLF